MWSLSQVILFDLPISERAAARLFVLYASWLYGRQISRGAVAVHFKALAHDFRQLGYFDRANIMQSKFVMTARDKGARNEARATSRMMRANIK